MTDGFNMEISWGTAVVKLATGKCSGGLRGELSPGQVAEYAGEVFDCIRAKVFFDNGNAGCLDECGKGECARGCCCRECILAGRFASVELSGIGSRRMPSLRVEQGNIDSEASFIQGNGSRQSLPLVSEGNSWRADDVSGVCSGIRIDGFGSTRGFLGGKSLEETRSTTNSVNCDLSDSKVKINDDSVPLGESKTERNRRWREEKKLLKKKRQAMNRDWRQKSIRFERGSNCASESSIDLRKTLEEKWKNQNELAAERARRELAVLKASDLDQEVKRYRTKVSAATERNMVSIERTHAKLRQTGNIPEERGGGFAETVVSGVPGLESGSGTISPDSSASMAEFRACQKALLDAERENAEYKRKIKIASEKYGFPLEQVDFLDKEVWTDTQTNQDILDEIYPNGYGKDTSLFEDGKFRAIGV